MAKKDSDNNSELNIKQELFCRFITQRGDTFGNRTLSYAEAYEYKLDELSQEPTKVKVGKKTKDGPSEYDKAYQVCGTEGARLLKYPKILARITVLLNELLKDDIVDSEMAKLIVQDDDLATKRAAIGDYNKLRGRIVDKSKVEIERFALDDVRTLLAGLPQERIDEVYAILTTAVGDAEALRSAAKVQSTHTQ